MAREPRDGGRGRDRDRDRDADDGIIDKLVTINRVAKVVKGGRRFAFAALVVVGDQKGRVGYGAGKAREVPEAIRKATERAKRGMIRVPMKEGRTLHHDVEGRYGAGKVVLRTAAAGTGIIAGGPMRAVFETLAWATWWRSRWAAATRTTWSRRRSRRCERCASPALGGEPARQEGVRTVRPAARHAAGQAPRRRRRRPPVPKVRVTQIASGSGASRASRRR